MSNRFDNVAKALASGMPRRKVLKLFVGGAAAVVTTSATGRYSSVQAEVNKTLPCINYYDPYSNTTDPLCNYTEPMPSPPDPIVNTIIPPSRPRPVINIPVPSFVTPGVNQTVPPVVVPPKLNLLPELFPGINWNFTPFNPTRRRR